MVAPRGLRKNKPILMALELDSVVFKAKATVLDELNRHHIEEAEEKAK